VDHPHNPLIIQDTNISNKKIPSVHTGESFPNIYRVTPSFSGTLPLNIELMFGTEISREREQVWLFRRQVSINLGLPCSLISNNFCSG
jgi:hypothetical protein